jgi:uncharacterized protein
MRLALLFAVVAACAAPALAADFTIPPAPTHYVTDNAAAISPATESSLDSKLKAYEAATRHQVIVWIGDTTGDVPLETWTGESAQQWRVGRHGYDDGAILFLFMTDHKVRIEVGYGLESKLTDADADRIIRDVVVPRMQAGRINDAVTSGVAAMLTTISPSYKGARPPPEAGQSSSSVSAFGIAIMAIIGAVLLYCLIAVVLRIIGMLRYGALVMREGKTKARSDMKSWPTWSAAGAASGGASTSFGSDSGGGDFSGGGGDFGGGGASGSW